MNVWNTWRRRRRKRMKVLADRTTDHDQQIFDARLPPLRAKHPLRANLRIVGDSNDSRVRSKQGSRRSGCAVVCRHAIVQVLCRFGGAHCEYAANSDGFTSALHRLLEIIFLVLVAGTRCPTDSSRQKCDRHALQAGVHWLEVS